MSEQPALESGRRRNRRRSQETAEDVNEEGTQEAIAASAERPAELPTKQRSESQVDKVANDPIAVIDPGGHIWPFTTNRVGREYLMMANVTYIWTQEELKKALEHNEKMISKRAFDRIAIGDVLPPKPQASMDSEEVRAAVFNPNMLQGMS